MKTIPTVLTLGVAAALITISSCHRGASRSTNARPEPEAIRVTQVAKDSVKESKESKELKDSSDPNSTNTNTKDLTTPDIGASRAGGGGGGLVALTTLADGGVAVRAQDGKADVPGERSRVEAEQYLGHRFATVQDFCDAWDAKLGPFLDARNKTPDDFAPKDHTCRSRGALIGAFTPTASVKGVTKVEVFSENWTESRIAIETPSGVFIPAGPPLDTTPFNDPGCYGQNTITIKSVVASGSTVTIRLEDRWSRSRYLEAEDGGILGTSKSDDVHIILMECRLDAVSSYVCANKTLSRVCHINGATVPCDSF